MGSKSLFPSIGLKLTGACRFGCPFCCEPNRQQNTFPIENFKEIIKVLKKEFGTSRLCLTGGDPLLYTHLEDLVKYSKKHDMYNLLLTADGGLLKQREKICRYIDAVRLSIHGLAEKHDEIVEHPGGFNEIESAIKMLNRIKVKVMVTTVVTRLTIDSIFQIAEWCLRKGIEEYYLFGIMKSGKGEDFENQHGALSEKEAFDKVKLLKENYIDEQLSVTYYDYRNKAECVIVYGDGRIVLDPYPCAPTHQLDIGNLLTDSSKLIKSKFMKDPENLLGYRMHRKKRGTQST